MDDILANGTRIAGFVLDDPLGRGGFGVTYRAHSADGGRVYAIKEYFPADLARRNARGHVVAAGSAKASQLFDLGRRAFLEEAYILRDLPRQPGLVRVRSAFEKHNTAYCVTDFIDGVTLDRASARIVDARGHLPEDNLSDLVATLCHALGAVHRAGFIHRDLKPANVMINRTGAPVLIDFGAARAHGDGQTMTSMLSRRYAALEQFPSTRIAGVGRMREGPWTDLYALSVMLYELMARALPPTAETRFAEVQAHRPDPYLPLREALTRNRINADYSPELLDLVDAGCSLMPQDRPATTEDFSRRIGATLFVPEETPIPATVSMPAPGITRLPDRPAPPTRKRLSADGGKVLLMLALIVGLAAMTVLIGLGG